MDQALLQRLASQAEDLERQGLLKVERVIASPQQASVLLADGRDRWGYGMASVRFICGTQSVHRELEERLAAFLGTEDAILYSSCFDANGGLFETLTDEQDAIISDALNHASLIDGIRLSRARRLRSDNRDLNQLEDRLRELLA